MAREYSLEGFSRQGQEGSRQIDYRGELNEEQFAAVTSPPGPSLVIAGAGSGKTRTLTYRVAYLLDNGVQPEQILLLTFTNKAAREMLERVEGLVSFDRRRLWGGTFHGIGARLLRWHGELLGLTRDFSILDRDDAKRMMATAVEESGVDTKALNFPKPEVILDVISMAANTEAPIKAVLEKRFFEADELLQPLKAVEKLYHQRKREANSVDFDDLLLLPLELLRKEKGLLEQFQERFRFVLVDEYQDTNAVQAELVDLMCGKHKSLMVVGDDAQSIYSWRGAEPENILGFTERYENARIYKIERNYRSVPEVLSLANEVIGHNERQFKKELSAVRDSGMMPAKVMLGDTRMQAAFVVQRVQELLGEGVTLSDVAVLYRSHFHATDLQLELSKAGIPYVITSGVRFYEQAHVKDVMAFLRLAANWRDEVSFKRMVGNAARGLAR